MSLTTLSAEARRAKLRWRCRRGMRELDIVLEHFLSEDFDALSETEQANFERLLDQTDPDLVHWLTGQSNAPDADLAQLVKRLSQILSNE